MVLSETAQSLAIASRLKAARPVLRLEKMRPKVDLIDCRNEFLTCSSTPTTIALTGVSAGAEWPQRVLSSSSSCPEGLNRQMMRSSIVRRVRMPVALSMRNSSFSPSRVKASGWPNRATSRLCISVSTTHGALSIISRRTRQSLSVAISIVGKDLGNAIADAVGCAHEIGGVGPDIDVGKVGRLAGVQVVKADAKFLDGQLAARKIDKPAKSFDGFAQIAASGRKRVFVLVVNAAADDDRNHFCFRHRTVGIYRKIFAGGEETVELEAMKRVEQFGLARQEMFDPKRTHGHAVAAGTFGQDAKFAQVRLVSEEDVEHRLFAHHGELVVPHMLLGLAEMVGHIDREAVFVFRLLVSVRAPAFVRATFVGENEATDIFAEGGLDFVGNVKFGPGIGGYGEGEPRTGRRLKMLGHGADFAPGIDGEIGAEGGGDGREIAGVERCLELFGVVLFSGQGGEHLENGAFDLGDAGNTLDVAEFAVDGIAQRRIERLDAVDQLVGRAQGVDHFGSIERDTFASGNGDNGVNRAPHADTLDYRSGKVILRFFRHGGKYYTISHRPAQGGKVKKLFSWRTVIPTPPPPSRQSVTHETDIFALSPCNSRWNMI